MRRAARTRRVARDWLIILGAAASLAGCEAQTPDGPQHLSITETSYDALPGWAEGTQAAAIEALRRSCARFDTLADDASIGPDGTFGRATDWREPCAAAAQVAAADHGAARRFLEHWFVPYRAADRDKAEGLITGYYEPELAGARQPRDGIAVPLYRRPPELVRADLGAFSPDLAGRHLVGQIEGDAFVPYYDRAAIDDGALAGRGLELLWVSDPTDAFFLQVQGSGRVVLEDGAVVRLGFAAHNGHPYVSIGRALVRRGAMAAEDVSLPAIRAWLAAHADEAAGILRLNPRYVFFRELSGPGPVGAAGVALTPGRSLAVDRAHIALGVPMWLDSHWPGEPARVLRRLVVAQDTGGAIKGPVRGDLFWGRGARAEALAGVMRSAGRYFLLLPRTVAAGRPAS